MNKAYPQAACLGWSLAVALVLGSSPLRADNLILDGTLLFNSQLRFEQVDDDAVSRDGTALTWRNRLGWKTQPVNGFYVVAEVEDVRALIDDYNSTANGQVQRAVIVDPEGTEWNQAYLGWSHADGHALALGRQRLSFDNHRFIGNVGWRQNEQTFDAISGQWQFAPGWQLRYAWLEEAHRIFGNNHPNPLAAEQDLSTHLLNLGGTEGPRKWSFYGYWYENEDFPATSTQTLGLRVDGKAAFGSTEGRAWLYTIEAARQSDYAEAPDLGSVSYWLLEVGVALSGHAIKLGWERLGSNGRRALQTPLATLHAFNGWADRFLVTPADGLEDRYLGADGPLGRLRYLVRWHDYRSDRGSLDLGSEFDAQLSWGFAPHWKALLKFAHFEAGDVAPDVDKFWLSLEYAF